MSARRTIFVVLSFSLFSRWAVRSAPKLYELYDVDSCEKSYLSASSRDRLQCLQFNLGKEKNEMRWSRGFVNQGEVPNREAESTGFLYQTCKCPLTYFSERGFVILCTTSIFCS